MNTNICIISAGYLSFSLGGAVGGAAVGFGVARPVSGPPSEPITRRLPLSADGL